MSDTDNRENIEKEKKLILRTLEENIEYSKDELNLNANIRLSLIYSEKDDAHLIHEISLIERERKSFIDKWEIEYDVLSSNINGEKIVKDENGTILVAEISDIEEIIASLKNRFGELEADEKTVSCSGIRYFNMQKIDIKNGICGVVQNAGYFSDVYHTNDRRFNSFRKEGKLF